MAMALFFQACSTGWNAGSSDASRDWLISFRLENMTLIKSLETVLDTVKLKYAEKCRLSYIVTPLSKTTKERKMTRNFMNVTSHHALEDIAKYFGVELEYKHGHYYFIDPLYDESALEYNNNTYDPFDKEP